VDTISFLSTMVKAIVDGKKTVTRRPLKVQPPDDYYYFGVIKNEVWFCSTPIEPVNKDCRGQYFNLECPYGKVGDILFLNEPWIPYKTNEGAGVYFEDSTFLLHSEALELCNGNGNSINSKWRSANTLPKWASRFKLQINNIEVEKLQDITDEGFRNEGIYLDYLGPSTEVLSKDRTRKDLFISFWNLCYRESFPWESNPYVWVLDFELKYL